MSIAAGCELGLHAASKGRVVLCVGKRFDVGVRERTRDGTKGRDTACWDEAHDGEAIVETIGHHGVWPRRQDIGHELEESHVHLAGDLEHRPSHAGVGNGGKRTRTLHDVEDDGGVTAALSIEGGRPARETGDVLDCCDQVGIFKPHIERGERIDHVADGLGDVGVYGVRHGLEEAVRAVHQVMGRLDAQTCGLPRLRSDIVRAQERQGGKLGEARAVQVAVENSC